MSKLPDGNLLVLNNAIFARPGRQFAYRDGRRFTPGPLEQVHRGTVPETVCLTSDGILVGCLRPGPCYWSDDLGQTWNPLGGIPDRGPEVYQPWIQALSDGRIACTGHYGYDDPISAGRQHENYINLHVFRLKVNRRTKDTSIAVERKYDATKRRWLNRFAIRLSQGDANAIADGSVEFGFVERRSPGY